MFELSDLPIVRGILRQNKNLGQMCWFGTGGNADFFFSPRDADDLIHFLTHKPAELPVLIFGVGSNMLIRDGGFRGVVIRLGNGFNFIEKTKDCEIRTGASMLDLNLAMYASAEDIAGLEFLSGIPGTLGGAIAMNAGAYGKEIKDVLLSAKAVDLKGNYINLKNEDFHFKYRGNGLDKELIFIEASLQGHEGVHEEIKNKILDIQAARASTQPIKSKTGGSTFVNPPSAPAWKLIDQAGCRGLTIGGAKVSELHCNFIINENNATAADIESLIAEVQRRVLEISGITLVTEIKIVGVAS